MYLCFTLNLHKIALFNENILAPYQSIESCPDFSPYHKVLGTAFVVSVIDFWFHRMCAFELFAKQKMCVTSISKSHVLCSSIAVC
jgi:hypothetical protein